MLRRILAALAALIMGVTGAVAVGSPAQAWVYCPNPPLETGALYIWSGQGYCTARFSRVGGDYNVCYNMYDAHRDIIAAVWNRRGWPITLYSKWNCDGALPKKYLGADNSDPNLYDDGLYHNVYSFKYFNAS
jgi:hypothetical protein